MTEVMVIIHLGRTSLYASSNLPRSSAGRASASLFGLAPGGVYLATNCYQLRGALLPHHFTLTSLSLSKLRRYLSAALAVGITPPRRYLAPCPMEPGLSSLQTIQRIIYTAITQPTSGKTIAQKLTNTFTFFCAKTYLTLY